MKLLLAMFVVMNGLDLGLTLWLLKGDHNAEANPVASLSMSQFGSKGLMVFKGAMTAFVIGVVGYIGYHDLRKARKVLWMSLLILGSVIVYSCLLIVVQAQP